MIIRRTQSACFLGILLVFFFALLVFILRQITLNDAEIGFLAASFGGLLSGGITLIGVRATLDNQYKKEFIDLYSQRKLILDEQLEEMNEIIGFIQDNVNADIRDMSYSEFKTKHQEKHEEFYAYIKKSTIINGQVYNITKEFRKDLNEIIKCIGPVLVNTDEITGEQLVIGICINAGKQEDYAVHLSNLKRYYQELKEIMVSHDFKYEKLTGI